VSLSATVLYLLLVNVIQWLFGGIADAITLRPQTVTGVSTYALPGELLGIRTNGIGLLGLFTSSSACIAILVLLP
jgi:hypothetical protein